MIGTIIHSWLSRISRIACLIVAVVITNSGEAVDFERDLKPVLEAKCLSCHNPNNKKGDLSMSTIAEIRAYEDELLIPGKHSDSLLHQVTISLEEGEDPEMPKKGEALSESEAKLLADWIDAGATWPDGLVLKEASKADKSWWAYQPLKKMRSADAGKANPIDAFIDAKLDEKGLKMNPPADGRTLIRRATYDLTGLPPSSAEVKTFEQDYLRDPNSAFRDLVDRLLASKHYGERWGRHWLDVVRFGESIGYERNVIVNDIWPFRDYVIESINDDKPFDRFIREHIAGDVFGKGDFKVEIGSAFLVAGPYDDVGNQDAAQKAQIRANTMDEIISATSEAFLGMTIGCARCHDHKFDPILQKDYYSLYATFSGVRHGSREQATAEQKAERSAKLKPLQDRRNKGEGERKKLEAAILSRARKKVGDYEKKWSREKVNRLGTEERFKPVTTKFVRLISEASDRNVKTPTGFGIDEFEIWSSGGNSRNVALSSNGSKASGEARKIEDFLGAYGAQLAIDGKVGERFLSAGNHLTIELAKPEQIDRVLFSSARNETIPEYHKFSFVAEYRIEVSDDGKIWNEVANSHDRKPVSDAHRNRRYLAGEVSPDEVKKLASLRNEISLADREVKAIPAFSTVWLGTRVAKDAEGPFHVFVGGNPQKKGAIALPAALSTLEEVTPKYELPAEKDEAARRLELAKWITHPENPLTPRVLANRLWQNHFGTGIVNTPNDFGYMGGRPSHPELLDFLAASLKRSGWRIKEMHRLIMNSKAYRQSSKWREDGGTTDGDSRLLWRYPPRRLSAEEIRDTMLLVSGKLDKKMSGPGFRLYHFMQDNVCTYAPLDKHGPETYRRAVYHQNARASVVDLMTEFDQADCAFSVPHRVQTTSPLQALTMLNHSFTLDMAGAFSLRLEKEDTIALQIRQAFQIAYHRAPDEVELRNSITAVGEHGLRGFCRALLNSNELIYLD